MIMEYTCFPENLIRCWCFDCNKIFLTDGNSQIGSTICVYCGNKNYDFDLNFRYSKRGIKRKTIRVKKRTVIANEVKQSFCEIASVVPLRQRTDSTGRTSQ